MDEENKLKLSVYTDEDSIIELLNSLPSDTKRTILDHYTWDEVIKSIERHLKGESSFQGWDSNGHRVGGRIRDEILKTQGIEPEYKKDLESRIQSLEHDVEHYKKYYDWQFKVYHDEELYDIVRRRIGFL